MFVIVSYDESSETDFVPMKWLTEDYQNVDVEKMAQDRATISLYWPPWKNPAAISRARRLLADAETSWPCYTARVLSYAGRHYC